MFRTLYDWDRQATEREYKRALELNPSYATAQLYGLYLSQIEKHDGAIAETRRALQLDPLSVGISSSRGLRLYFARRYDQAIKQFADALELDSNTHSRTFGSGGLTNKRGITGRRLLKSRKPSLFPKAPPSLQRSSVTHMGLQVGERKR